MQPKAIIFDFFGVICANVAGDWLSQHDQGEVLREKYFHRADEATISEEELFRGLADGVGGDASEIRALMLKNSIIDEDMVSLIKELQGKYKLAICTNAPKDFFYTVLERASIRDLFNVIVCSSEEGVVKPNPKIFEIVLERLGVASNEAVFIDDTERNVIQAEELGMKGIVFRNASQVRELL